MSKHKMEVFIKEFEAKIKTVLENLKQELIGLRTNRPHPQLVSDVKVMYNETQFLLKQLGSIGINPPREIVVSVWDIASAPAVAKALEMSVPGATVSLDGQNVRVNLPPLSDERRKELAKAAKAITEERKIHIRSMRDEINKRLERMKKESEITEDMNFKGKKRIQEIVDKVGKDIEIHLASKVKDIES